MSLSIQCPSLLTLGTGVLNGAPGLAAVTLAVPILSAEAHPASTLSISGASADVATRWAHAAGLHSAASIEIESAIPRHMGLGADGMMAEAMRALLTGGKPAQPSSPAAHALCAGGLVFVGRDGRLLRRCELRHTDADAWVFVLVLPMPPDDTPDNLEAARAHQLLDAAPRHDLGALFDAADASDFDGFCAQLHALRDAQASTVRNFAQPAESVPLAELLAAQHPPYCGATATGLGLFALTRGAPASRTVRNGLKQVLGYGGPIILGSICDNQGAQLRHT